MWTESIRVFNPFEATKAAIAKEQAQSCSKCKIPFWARITRTNRKETDK